MLRAERAFSAVVECERSQSASRLAAPFLLPYVPGWEANHPDVAFPCGAARGVVAAVAWEAPKRFQRIQSRIDN